MSILSFARAGGLALFALVATSFAAPQEWVGKSLPDLKVEYLKTAPETKGKPMLVEFWATWCPPCRKSIPHLNELHEKYKGQGLQIIGISDEKRPLVEKFQQTTPMNYNVALDPKGALLQQFGIEGIPHSFVVDKAGKIVWQGHPMTLKEETLESVLK